MVGNRTEVPFASGIATMQSNADARRRTVRERVLNGERTARVHEIEHQLELLDARISSAVVEPWNSSTGGLG